MKYSKPIVMNPTLVDGAKCGGGPCGRPKDGSRQKNIEAAEKSRKSENSK